MAALFVLVAAATQGGDVGDGADGLLELSSLGGGKAGEALARLFDEYQTIYVSQRK